MRHNENTKFSERFHDVEFISATLDTLISNGMRKLRISEAVDTIIDDKWILSNKTGEYGLMVLCNSDIFKNRLDFIVRILIESKIKKC